MTREVTHSHGTLGSKWAVLHRCQAECDRRVRRSGPGSCGAFARGNEPRALLIGCAPSVRYRAAGIVGACHVELGACYLCRKEENQRPFNTAVSV